MYAKHQPADRIVLPVEDEAVVALDRETARRLGSETPPAWRPPSKFIQARLEWCMPRHTHETSE
jgi:hypothetical protein